MSKGTEPAGAAGDALAAVRAALGGEGGGPSGATFMRGLTLGALLGAAIAGSAVWQRRGRARRERSGGETAT